MINSHCYSFEYRKYKEGILDSFVDATYILTLVGSERINNINKQLEYIIPTKNVFIVLNKGYKKCYKILTKNLPPYDITDAYFNTIEHSLKNNFNNILILEDDFIFSEKLKNKNIINEIDLFFLKNKKKSFYYNLGTIPYLFLPNINICNNTFKSIFCLFAHANIYTKNIRLEVIKQINNKNIRAWDFFLNDNYDNYFYKYPLIYQTFPITDNRNVWYSDNNNSLLNNSLNYITSIFFKMLQLDKKPEPGFSILYIILFIFNYLLWLLPIIIIIYYLLKNNYKKVKNIK